jgi:hypothetical protein
MKGVLALMTLTEELAQERSEAEFSVELVGDRIERLGRALSSLLARVIRLACDPTEQVLELEAGARDFHAVLRGGSARKEVLAAVSVCVRGEGRTRMGREARWPLEPVCLPGGSTTRAN